jgi:hypothetical protein
MHPRVHPAIAGPGQSPAGPERDAPRGRAVRSIAKSSERSFDAEVAKLALGAGQIFRGEALLAIAKGLLQAVVSYLGGYPGAPVAHLLDILADAYEPVLKPAWSSVRVLGE